MLKHVVELQRIKLQ